MISLVLFENVRNEIESLFRSRLQILILLTLIEGMKSLSDLRGVTGSSSQALLPIIRKMERNHLIDTTKNEYRLTSLGFCMAKKIEGFIFYLSLIKKEGSFWNNHYLEAIPYPLLQNLGHIYNSTVIADTNSDIFRVYNNFLKIINESQYIHAISSIMSIGHADAISQNVRKGKITDLIVSRDVSIQMNKEPYLEKMHALASYNNFTVRVASESLLMGVTVTDRHLSLGLYKQDKITYDTTTDIFSEDPAAIAWGERLFQYYKDRSTQIFFQ